MGTQLDLRSKDEDGYKVKAKCRNCGWQGVFIIDKGVLANQQDTICIVCGCSHTMVYAHCVFPENNG